MAKKKSVEQAARIRAREEQVNTALGEIINAVENYFSVAPFAFLAGQAAEPGGFYFRDPPKTRFNRFEPWMDYWMGALFPESLEAQAGLASEGIDSDHPGALAFASLNFGFVLGMLCGCKAMGATKDQLAEKARGFAFQAIESAKHRAGK